MAVDGREESHQGPRALPAANGEFIPILISIDIDARNGACITRLFGVTNDQNLVGRHWSLRDSAHHSYRGLRAAGQLLKSRRHYPITSSASASSVGGTVRPSASAAFRLMTNHI
jgi:hypothetical protein